MKRANYFLQKNHLIFWSILLFSLASRLLYITEIPSGINQDEAMLSMDAWALSQYGTDRYGTFLPVHFAAWQSSQMSVLLGYLIVPFIQIFGFHLWVIRLPLALFSTLGIALLYLVSRRFFSEHTALCIMALGAINPWQFMQSRWALDCNLFPHIFLLGFYFLLIGLEKRHYLYLSMFFFGLTFYCYGIAIYTVPVFLFVYAAWCLWKHQLKLWELGISVLIFSLTALPEILTMAINLLGYPTIETPFFTMPLFPNSVRSADILFMNFSCAQLGKNICALMTQVFLQLPDHLFNTLPAFGPLYHISIPFIFIGIFQFFRRFRQTKDLPAQTRDLALIGFLIMGLWAGVITREVNVNRINIIFYPLLILCGYGIEAVLEHFADRRVLVARAVLILYTLCGAGFFTSYFTSFAQDIKEYFNVDFLAITKEVDSYTSFDSLYITGNMGWQYNVSMAEILTQYTCQIDAHYYQELTTTTGGRTLLPYSERYHFLQMASCDFHDTDAAYILCKSELDCLPDAYHIIAENNTFLAITLE